MIFKLAINAKKGRWQDLSLDGALEYLYGEYVELVDARNRGNMVEVLLEGADVSNFAMIAAAIAMEHGT